MQELEPKVQGGGLMRERGHNCGILRYTHTHTHTHTHTTEYLKNAWLFTLVSLTSILFYLIQQTITNSLENCSEIQAAKDKVIIIIT